MKKLILASSSIGRLAVLKKLNIVPDEIISPHIDEQPLKKEKPRDLSRRLAQEKAFAVLALMRQTPHNLNDTLILSGDTVSARGRLILEKASNDTEVEHYLQLLSGRNSRVYSSFCILDAATNKFTLQTVETRLKMRYISKQEIAFYVQLQEGIGKAGGFTIGGFGECFIQKIVGSYSCVLGLPSLQVMQCLKTFGYNNMNNNVI